MLKRFLVVFFGILPFISISQNCVDYGEFDDAPCDICGPGDWDPILAAEIDDVATLNWCPNMSESPTGGTMVALDILAGNPEGIETTIDGLTPGLEYSLGFWWFCCDLLSDADLIIEVDGTTFTFGTTYDWELVTMCVTPESSSIDILITAEPENNQSFVFVDDAFCTELETCCSLLVDLDDELFVCPNEELQLDAFIDMEIGNLTFEWTSNPADGIDYLSDITIKNPVFFYEYNDFPFDGVEYEFTLTVEDDECESKDEITISVYPLEEFTFNFIDDLFCETDEEFVFPLVSSEGISGTWDISSFLPEDYPNGSIENTFTADDGEVECPTPMTIEIDIEAIIIPEFDLPQLFCEFDDQFIFPTSSDNGINGSWDLEVLNPSDLSPDDYINTFTPDEPFCIAQLEIEFEIIETINPVFNLESTICSQSDEFDLPTESDNNIDGSWTPSSVDPSSITDSLVCIFSSEEDLCIENFRHVFYPSNLTTPSFTLQDSICRNGEEIFLPSESNEGDLGSWDISSFLPADIASESLMVTWTPDSDNNCIELFYHTFNIKELTIPQFNLPNNACVIGDTIHFMPTSQNGISGSWTVAYLYPGTFAGNLFENTFIPFDLACSEMIEISIPIVDEIIPTFTIPDTLCALDNILEFPLFSNESFEGYWISPILDPSNYMGETFTNTFINTDVNNECIQDSTSLNIFIEPLEIPVFGIQNIICVFEEEFTLPTLSLNNIEGSWNLPLIDPSMFPNEILDLQFIPNDINCYDTYELGIQIAGPFDGIIQETAASDCSSNDGTLEIITQLQSLEFSIDGNGNWQSEFIFENLTAGNHLLSIRYFNIDSCIEIFTFTIDSPMQPEILETIVSPVSSCVLNNGSIQINMAQGVFEFSIDNGLNWQENNTFVDLSSGIYEVSIRPINAPDCIITTFAEVEDVPDIFIDNIFSISPTGCLLEDGYIEIFASGIDLLYSIDAGSTSSNDNIFSNLVSGTYDIIISSALYLDCIETTTITLESPDNPIIENIIVTNPKDCPNELGQIEVVTQNINIQFSIDNGATWQSSPIFDNLDEGNYEVVIQSNTQSDCTSNIFDIELILEEIELLQDLDLSVNDPTNCENTNGSIALGIFDNTLEFSIDDGATWQSTSTFENLIPGNFNIQVRQILVPECFRIVNDIALIYLDCPCADLEFDLDNSDNLCDQGSNGFIEILNITGFDNQINGISWADGQTGSTIDNLNSGWHIFTIDYDDQCLYSDSIFINEYDPITFLLESFDSECDENNNGSLSISNLSGGSGNYNYSLNGYEFQDDPIFYNLSPGAYEAYVIDSLGCLKSELAEVFNGGTVNIDLPDVMSINLGEQVFLNPLINENTIDSFIWSPQIYILNPGELVAEVSPQETTQYELTIFYGECTEVRTVTVNVNFNKSIYLGTVFSPDGDGNNDNFFIQSDQINGISIIKFRIFDRWGNLVFDKINPEVNNESDGWDGYYNGDRATLGVYVFTVEYEVGGEVIIQSGTVTLIR